MTRGIQAGFVAGTLGLLGGAALAPQQTWGALLLVSFYVAGLALAGMLFVALEDVTGASWSVSFRRVPEAMSATLPAGAAGVGLVLAFGTGLYPWMHEPLHGFKGAWLSLPLFAARAVVYVLLWLMLGRALVRDSRRGGVRTSIVFLLVFAVTFSLASFDWIMSLEPHWASTIFGVYNFAGMFSSGIAALIVLIIWQRRAGPLRDFVNEEHLHDLGKLYFAFSTFWMYIWFSQYMLIWYANITEESAYFVRRQHGVWGTLLVLNVFLNWVVPFLALLSKRVKRNPRLLVKVAAVGLAGRWLDLYLMIAPAASPGAPRFGPIELALTAGAGAAFVSLFSRAWRQAPPVPVHDPRLAESLAYHN